MISRLYSVEGFDLFPVFERIAANGHGAEVLAVIDGALHSAVDRLGGPGAELELEDLLLHLVELGHSEEASVLLNATAGWLVEHLRAAPERRRRWEEEGRRPGDVGYGEARAHAIRQGIRPDRVEPYGGGCAALDERVVEYAWVFDRLARVHPQGAGALDAGSTMNHADVLAEWSRRGWGPLSIVTLHCEGWHALSDRFRYEFADLRHLPYRDHWFRTVLCLSTLEHVGMDNTRYGAGEGRSDDPQREARAAVAELRRVLAPDGRLLLSVPFGRSADRGWQRIFGQTEVEDLLGLEGWARAGVRVFRSFPAGWREVAPEEAIDAGYNDADPGGLRDAPEWVAAAEAVALLEMTKR